MDRGHTLIESLALVFLIGLGTAIAVPYLGAVHRDAALRRATDNVLSQLWRARAESVTTGAATALVLDRFPDGRWRCRVARDGDGDGIRRSDLKSGRDTVVGRVLELKAGGAGFGILREVSVPNPSGGGVLGGDLDDPVRAGSGDILTFTPQGTATSGSLYLTDHRGAMRAIRIFGVTGRMRTLEWRIGWEEWRRAR